MWSLRNVGGRLRTAGLSPRRAKAASLRRRCRRQNRLLSVRGAEVRRRRRQRMRQIVRQRRARRRSRQPRRNRDRIDN